MRGPELFLFILWLHLAFHVLIRVLHIGWEGAQRFIVAALGRVGWLECLVVLHERRSLMYRLTFKGSRRGTVLTND